MRTRGDRILERRTELGLSARTLAARAKMTSTIITTLENGQQALYLTLTEIERLAAELAVDIKWILDLEEEPSLEAQEGKKASDDSISKLGALLATAGSKVPTAAALELFSWTEAELEAALARLDIRLRACGQRLRWDHEDGTVGVASDPDAGLSKTEVKAVVRASVARVRLDPNGARILYAVTSREVTYKGLAADNNMRVQMGRLIHAGILEEVGKETEPLRLTPQARRSLVLDERPDI